MRKLMVLNRFLAYDNGEPFFYLGDTAWEIFHRLNREEMAHYFAVRAQQGFTVIQGVALAEMEGVTTPNAYGRLPLHFSSGLPDPEKPDTDGDYSYWDHVDFAVEEAAKNGLFIALLPTWGDKFHQCWGKGPEIFTEKNAYVYGRWLGRRYGEKENILWMLGGDRPLEDAHRRIVAAMARGIREADENHLITFHPCGCSTSFAALGDAPFLDFHTAQTGHDVSQCWETYRVMLDMAANSPKPYMDSEPRYEDHPACFDANLGYFWQAGDVRQNAYWNVFSGACGHTYGNHSVWSMNTEPSAYFPFTWQDALEHEGACQMSFVKQLRLKRDYFSLRPAPELLAENLPGMGYRTAARGKGYAYVYAPLGLPFTVNLSAMEEAGRLRAAWFDPRKGTEQVFSVLPARGRSVFVPPAPGKDWVLVLENV